MFKCYQGNYFLAKSMKACLYKKCFSSKLKNKDDNIFSHLDKRNLISNISHPFLLDPKKRDNTILEKDDKVYIGFDPTAESLHLGNLIGIITALRFGKYGIDPVFVIGGATGQIGDPSGKIKERGLLQKDKIDENCEKIKQNIINVLANIENNDKFKEYLLNGTTSSGTDSSGEEDLELRISKLKSKEFLRKYELPPKKIIEKSIKDYLIINNKEFYEGLSIIDFLRNVGTNMRMGPLLSRECVKNRIDSKDGLSLAEFMYQTFQGYDFYKLNEKYNVKIQIGGSDQWGNMLAGQELIKKISNKDVINMTFPLMTTSTGQKFGKSEGNALFLNPKLTPINNIYQYFYNTSDNDLPLLLNSFTFLEEEDIEKRLESHYRHPEKRMGQKLLAENIISLLYSKGEFTECEKQCQIHYLAKSTKCNAVLEELLKEGPVKEISQNSFETQCVSKICIEQRIFEKKSDVKRLIEDGAVYVNNNKIQKDTILNKNMLTDGGYLILQTGKKKINVFKVIQDSINNMNSPILII